MVRHNGNTIRIPVSVVTDCDVEPYELHTQEDGTRIKKFSEKVEESNQAVTQKSLNMKLEQFMHSYHQDGHWNIVLHQAVWVMNSIRQSIMGRRF